MKSAVFLFLVIIPCTLSGKYEFCPSPFQDVFLESLIYLLP